MILLPYVTGSSGGASGGLVYLNTVPCDDCGEPIDHLRHPWFPLYPDGQLCHRCGKARGLTGVIPAGSP